MVIDMRKSVIRYIGLTVMLTVLFGVFGKADTAQAASAWSFEAGSGKKITVNGMVSFKKNEYQNINLYKNGKEIKENDATYKVVWSSSDPDVVWVDQKTGQMRADKFRKMTADSAKAKITATITNKKSKAVAKRSFTIQVVSKVQQQPTATPTPSAAYPDMSVFPAWFELPDATVQNRATPTPVPMITKETKPKFYASKTVFIGDELGRVYAVDEKTGMQLPVEYVVKDSSVVAISEDGRITPLKPGTTQVILTAGEYKSFVDITVKASAYSAVKGETKGVSEDEKAAANVVLDFIEKNIKADMSTYEKIRLAHDYIISNTEYKNRDNERDHNILGPLLDGYAVCEGYAKAFDLFMYAMDIDCILVTGEAGEPHAWNIVWIDGVPYHIDLTWDDPLGLLGFDSGKISYEYFLLPEAYITKTHSFEVTDYPYCKDNYYTYYTYRNNLISTIYDYADKFKELYKQNPSEVVILYPEYAMPNKDSIWSLNGNRGYSYTMDGNGGLPTIGEYTLLRIMTK